MINQAWRCSRCGWEAFTDTPGVVVVVIVCGPCRKKEAEAIELPGCRGRWMVEHEVRAVQVRNVETGEARLVPAWMVQKKEAARV